MTSARPSLLVTGASRGIGRAIVEQYLARDWMVFGCSRSPSPVQHAHYVHCAADVGDENDVLDLFAEIRRRGVALDALVNNAGTASMNHALTTPASTMQKLWAVNVHGTMLCCREAAKQMVRKRSGRIVNCGSVAVPWSLEGESVYTATKAAVEAYTRVLARELGEWGVTVNAVSPNPVHTDLIAGVPKEKMDRLVARQSIRRYGTVEDVIHAVDFFLDPKSSLITGQVLYLGGP